MAESNRPYTRRHYVVKKRFQASFILKFCLLILGGMILSSLLLLLISQDTLTSSFENSRLVIEATSRAILPGLVITNLITVILITAAAAAVMIFVSHRIAGPLYRLEKEIRRIGEGDLSVRVALRRKDQVGELAQALNEATSSVHSKLLRMAEKLEEAKVVAAREEGCRETLSKLEELENRIRRDFALSGDDSES
jgi:methyl-accepting chemotaxis protein